MMLPAKMALPASRGLGDWGCMGAHDYNINSQGLTIDCSCISNLTEPACWGFPGSSSLPAGTTANGPAPPLAPTSSFFSAISGPLLGAVAVLGAIILLKR